MPDFHKANYVTFNFRATPNGPDFSRFQVGSGPDDAKEIWYHEPQGPGDVHYVDVLKNNGAKFRLFNINMVALA